MEQTLKITIEVLGTEIKQESNVIVDSEKDTVIQVEYLGSVQGGPIIRPLKPR